MNKAKLLVALLIVALIGAVFVLGLHQYLSLDFLRAQQQSMQIFVEQNLTGAAVAFFFLYVTVAALNIPGAAIMTPAIKPRTIRTFNITSNICTLEPRRRS